MKHGRHWHEGGDCNITTETSKMECGDRRVPPTLRAVSWLRQLELGETNLETANLRVANLEDTNSEIAKQELWSRELRTL